MGDFTVELGSCFTSTSWNVTVGSLLPISGMDFSEKKKYWDLILQTHNFTRYPTFTPKVLTCFYNHINSKLIILP